MALSWIDFINGEALSSVRAKINGFNGSVVTDVNTNTTNTTTNTANILTNTNGLASIVSGDTAVEKGRLIPTATPPAHVEGQWYYNNNAPLYREFYLVIYSTDNCNAFPSHPHVSVVVFKNPT